MNEWQKIEIVTSSARINISLQSPSSLSLEATPQGIKVQTHVNQTVQKREVQETILNWLVAKRAAQEAKLRDAELRPAQEVLIRHVIAQIDEEISALLKSSGMDEKTVNQAIELPNGPSYSGNGRLFS